MYSVNRILAATSKLAGKYNPPTYTDTRVNVYSYLIIGDSDILLIDTGIGKGNDYIDFVFEPISAEIPDELAKFGIEVGDVTSIINSHLHFDHCGNNQLFGNAKIYIQKSELEIARKTKHTVREWFDYEDANIVEVTKNSEIFSGIYLIATPGHTPGHQSILVETEEGKLLVAAQAAYTADEFRQGGDPDSQAHPGYSDIYRESISMLNSLDAKKIYFSHDDRVITL